MIDKVSRVCDSTICWLGILFFGGCSVFSAFYFRKIVDGVEIDLYVFGLPLFVFFGGLMLIFCVLLMATYIVDG